MKIYNTGTNQKEELIPYNKSQFHIYVCGITPYNDCHIGHARCYIIFDTLRRYLIHKGNTVKYVQNYTDIDDKIIKAAKELNITEKEVSEKYISEYIKIRERLNILKPDFEPKVTEHIGEIIKFIEKIISNNKAYIVNGDVYISIENDELYGSLSKKKLDELVHGSRVEINKNKKSLLDFVLWKNSNEGEIGWSNPWSKSGRPGWHIECSAMSIKYLGVPPEGGIDIHGGGMDLIFPHHENEIIQSRYALGFSPVKYWVHNGFVTIKKEKMSKSLGNFFTIKEVLEKYSPEILRLALLSAHYRSPFEYDLDKIKEYEAAIKRVEEVMDTISFIQRSSNIKTLEVDETITSKIENCLEDDFNTQTALSVLFSNLVLISSLIREKQIEKLVKIKNTYIYFFNTVFGIKLKLQDYSIIPKEIESLLTERGFARKNKNFKSSDEIRKKISDLGYEIKDTEFGQIWKKK